jgi:signal transduction histidine kinase
LFQYASPELKLPSDDRSGADEKNEILFTTKSGKAFTGEITYSKFLNANGRHQLVMNIRDISGRRQMEQQLLREQKKYERKLTHQIILAQERERQAIGHELHDNINQILTTVKLYLELAHDRHELREQLLPRSATLVQACIQEIRALSHELCDPTHGPKTLVESIKALIDQVSASSSLDMQFNYDTYKYYVDKDQHLAIYRILQEQLTNIIKHAEATEVNIDLFQDNQYTGIAVQDNGKGFHPQKSRQGIGLNNIQSRAKVLGGHMKIESAPGSGCLIEVRLPMPEDAR